MGYVMAFSACYGCGVPFSYNPHLVPSITPPAGKRGAGVRQPICGGCVAAANPVRVANGLAPIVILDGAYEAMDEAEL
jgi:hypothetical protein